jgi:hypothetical protein
LLSERSNNSRRLDEAVAASDAAIARIQETSQDPRPRFVSVRIQATTKAWRPIQPEMR